MNEIKVAPSRAHVRKTFFNEKTIVFTSELGGQGLHISFIMVWDLQVY